jgi:GNAT superfamily N-acetyltransferase
LFVISILPTNAFSFARRETIPKGNRRLTHTHSDPQKGTQMKHETIRKITTFNSCDKAVRKRFETFVRALTVTQDNEPGDDPQTGTWCWVLENNPTFLPGEPHNTFIFTDDHDQIIATATLTHDDRGTACDHGLSDSPEYLGIFGFFQVRRELRGQGIGTFISAYMNDHVQQFVDSIGQPKSVYLFTNNPVAMRIYSRIGFTAEDDCAVNIPELGGEDEQLMCKRYQPSTAIPQPQS